MSNPKELKYTNDHEWIRVEGEIGYVGITFYAQKELGDIVFLEIETEGETIEQEDVFGTVEAVKTVSDLYMPVTGEILEVNPAIKDNPELVNKDPFNKGWLIKVKIINPEELDDLLSADEYEKLIG